MSQINSTFAFTITDSKQVVPQNGEMQIIQYLNSEEYGGAIMATHNKKRKTDHNDWSSEFVKFVATAQKKLKTNEVADQQLLLAETESTTPSSSRGREQTTMQAMTVYESHYDSAMFQYLKEKELANPICDYMISQINISKEKRFLLVEWLVELQQSFELGHETLYLAVKIVDTYLSYVIIQNKDLPLLAAAAFLIACKCDRHKKPRIADFVHLFNGAYTRAALISMERTVLFRLNFQLSFPLSYNFLRHFAAFANVSIPTLTLARYILELSLLDYEAVTLSGSKMAAAALFMALRMHGVPKPWTRKLEDRSSYGLKDIAIVVRVLNAALHSYGNSSDTTSRNKYSHRVFHEVAKVPHKTNEELFETYAGLNNWVNNELNKKHIAKNSFDVFDINFQYY